MNKKELRFIGLSKNCFDNLCSNLDFLQKFKNFSNFKIEIIIIDSDSIDGTKKFCRDLERAGKLDKFIEVDNLSQKFESRIERLTYCRNIGLEEIRSTYESPLIYIPMDMDLQLFDLINVEEFENLINLFIEEKNFDCILPFSVPYYYDIFALRKKDWVDGNALLKAYKLKKKFYLGSFIFNYFYIFRKQLGIKSFKNDFIKVESAFGGMGLYKISDINLLKENYKIDELNVDFVTEHIAFNKFFENIYISKNWNIKAPKEHTVFKSSNFTQKFIYILRTLKYDFLGLFNALRGKI